MIISVLLKLLFTYYQVRNFINYEGGGKRCHRIIRFYYQMQTQVRRIFCSTIQRRDQLMLNVFHNRPILGTTLIVFLYRMRF